MRLFFAWLSVLGTTMIGAGALADPAPEASPAATAETAPHAPVTPAPRRPAPAKRGARASEKEAEGTEARNRFDGDSVVKSKYHLNGEPLEVDPD